jgi:hypothetical protein
MNRMCGGAHIATRIDQFLIHSSRILLGRDAFSKVFPHGESDHRPIKLSMEKGEYLGPITFWFNPV